MLADRLQLTVLCQMGPMKILYLDHHSCWPGRSNRFILAENSSDICPTPKFLQLQRCPQLSTAEGRTSRCSSCLQPLWTAAKDPGQDRGLKQAATTHGYFDNFYMVLLQDHISIACFTHRHAFLTLFSKHRLFTVVQSTKLCWLDPLFDPLLSELRKNALKETAFQRGLSNAVSPRSSVSHPWAWGRHKPFGRGCSPLCSRPKAAFSSRHPPCCSTTSAWLHPIKSSQQNLPSSVPDSYEKQQTCWVKCKVSSIFIWLIRTAHQMKTKTWFTAELVQVVVA